MKDDFGFWDAWDEATYWLFVGWWWIVNGY